jgi:hypothetical protein
VQQRLPTREDDAADAKPSEEAEMRLQLLGTELTPVSVCFPDVAHDAPAIAPAVRHENDYRQSVDAVGGKCALALYQLKWGTHQCALLTAAVELGWPLDVSYASG